MSRLNRIRRRRDPATGDADAGKKVPGPTANPYVNIIMADIVMRTGSYVLRSVVERSFLKGRYGRQTAREIMQNRPMSHRLAAIAVAKLASRSLPGAAIVSGGILARTLYERGKARRQSLREGDAKLLEQAGD